MKKPLAKVVDALSAEFQDLSREVAAERKAKKHPRAPFSLSLLKRIHDLGERAPNLGVYSHLKISRSQTLSRINVAQRGQPRLPASREEQPSFLELAQSSRRPLLITIDRGDGIRLTVEIDAARTGEVPLLVARMLGDGA